MASADRRRAPASPLSPTSPGGAELRHALHKLALAPPPLSPAASSATLCTDLDAEFGHITTPRRQRSQQPAPLSGPKPRVPRLVLPGLPMLPRAAPAPAQHGNPFVVTAAPPPRHRILEGGPTINVRPAGNREILEAEELSGSEDDELGPAQGRRVVSNSSMQSAASGATVDDDDEQEAVRRAYERPDDASDYYPSDPEDFTTFENLTRQASPARHSARLNPSVLAVAWADSQPVAHYEIPSFVPESLLGLPRTNKRVVARGWDTLFRVRRRAVEVSGRELDVGYYLARAYRFNRSKGKWSDKGPTGIFLVGGLGGAGCCAGISLYGTRNEVFCFPVWEDFPRLLRAAHQPATAGKGPRYLLTFHTAAQSSVSAPRMHIFPQTLGQLHPHNIRGDSEWARVEVAVVQVEGSVAAERDDEHRRGGTMWCLSLPDGSQAEQLYNGLAALARQAGEAAVAERAATFLAPRQPVPAGLDAEGRWRFGNEAPDEARRRAAGMGGVQWPLSTDGALLEYLARQRLSSLPLVSAAGEVVADAVRCGLCGWVCYAFAEKDGADIAALHRGSRESAEFAARWGGSGCWGCEA